MLCVLYRYEPLSWEFPSWASINGPAVNILKGAVVTSDRIVTVSEVIFSSPCIAQRESEKLWNQGLEWWQSYVAIYEAPEEKS